MADIDRLWTDADRALAKLQRQVTRDLLREYQRTLREIRSLMSDIFEKYSRGGVLTYAEMSKYGRLAKLEAALAELLRDHGGRVGRVERLGLEETYDESHKRSGYVLALLLALGYGVLKREAIKSAVQKPILGLTLDEIIKRQKQDLAWRVREVVVRGLFNGKSYTEMARELRKLFDEDIVRSLRVVKTQAHRLVNEARFDVGKKAVDGGADLLKVWNSVLIPTTRDAHREMHGQVREPDEEFDSPTGAKGMFPGGFSNPADDYNCLCFLTWITREGKTIIDDDVSFDEWERRL